MKHYVKNDQTTSLDFLTFQIAIVATKLLILVFNNWDAQLNDIMFHDCRCSLFFIDLTYHLLFIVFLRSIDQFFYKFKTTFFYLNNKTHYL